jgi:hypothetical protein
MTGLPGNLGNLKGSIGFSKYVSRNQVIRKFADNFKDFRQKFVKSGEEREDRK